MVMAPNKSKLVIMWTRELLRVRVGQQVPSINLASLTLQILRCYKPSKIRLCGFWWEIEPDKK